MSDVCSLMSRISPLPVPRCNTAPGTRPSSGYLTLVMVLSYLLVCFCLRLRVTPKGTLSAPVLAGAREAQTYVRKPFP